MFSYCNRNNSVSDKNQDMFKYRTNDYDFKHKPWLCNGSFQQQKQNRGIPSNLVDLNSKIRGQGAEYQCLNDTKEIQYGTLRPRPFFDRIGGAGPSMTVTSYTSEISNARDNRNSSRPVYGHPDMKYSNSDRL
jgi:hypothetical protein